MVMWQITGVLSLARGGRHGVTAPPTPAVVGYGVGRSNTHTAVAPAVPERNDPSPFVTAQPTRFPPLRVATETRFSVPSTPGGSASQSSAVTCGRCGHISVANCLLTGLNSLHVILSPFCRFPRLARLRRVLGWLVSRRAGRRHTRRPAKTRVHTKYSKNPARVQ